MLPELNGKLDGIAMRVPVPDGSVVDFNVRIKVDVTVDQVNDAVRSASESGSLKIFLNILHCRLFHLILLVIVIPLSLMPFY